MSLPCFHTSHILQADLELLDYPHANTPAAVSHTGSARLETLRFLAQIVDPSIQPADLLEEQSLANFWTCQGLNANRRNNAGHIVPLTVAGDKLRERHLAAAYLRYAIDLAMAVRRRREQGRDVLVGEEGEMGEEDVENDRILEVLIRDRAVLFPSSVGMLGKEEGKKRRVLSVRKGDNRKVPKVDGRKGNGGTIWTCREDVLQRLRELQRETADLNREKEDDCEKGEFEADLDEHGVKEFAADCEKLTELVAEFGKVVERGVRERAEMEEKGILTKRDQVEEEKVNAAAEECQFLEGEMRSVFDRIARLKAAMAKIRKGKSVMESLLQTDAMQAVRDTRRHVEGQSR